MSGRKRLSPEVRQEKLDAAHERLVDAVAGLVSSEDWTRYLKAMSRFHGYSAANVAMIMSQRPDAELVAGYRAWQALGRQVHKGAKGIAIWSPVVRRIETEDPESGEVEVARRRTGFRIAYVFDVTDTEGDEIPLPPARARLLEGDVPDGMWDFLAAQVAEAGYTLAVIPLVPGRPSANGETDFLTRQVVVAAEGRSPAAQAKTLAHELAHVLLHAGGFENRHRAEVEAESVAFLVCHSFGLDSMDYSLGYVSGWSSGSTDQVLATARAVQQCAAQILGAPEVSAGEKVA